MDRHLGHSPRGASAATVAPHTEHARVSAAIAGSSPQRADTPPPSAYYTSWVAKVTALSNNGYPGRVSDTA